MKEYWLNAYYYVPLDKTFIGKQSFKSVNEAINYVPSFGLIVAYRIHVRLK